MSEDYSGSTNSDLVRAISLLLGIRNCSLATFYKLSYKLSVLYSTICMAYDFLSNGSLWWSSHRQTVPPNKLLIKIALIISNELLNIIIISQFKNRLICW